MKHNSANLKSRYLIDALFDFEALPGRYPLTLREPRELFDCSRNVLRLAAGHSVPGLVLDSLEVPRVQKAACFFVRRALLRPGADHYTLLGLEPRFHKDALREHYRMLIRLTHPDFSVSTGSWPTDAATRINQANDVLASVVSRADYDLFRASGVARRMTVNSLAAVLPRPTERPKYARWGWALASVVTVAFALLTLTQWPGNIDNSHLTQLTIAEFPVVDAEPIYSKSPGQVAKVGQAPREAQVAIVAQASKVAQAPKQAQVIKVVQGAKDTQIVKMSQAFGPEQEVTIGQFSMVAAVLFKPVVPALQPPQFKLASEPAVRLNLADAQPALNQLIQSMQAGRSEDILRGLDRSVRQSKGAADLVNAYNFLVGGSSVVRLGPVQLWGRPNADQLMVDGVVQLVLHDQGNPLPVRELRLRALFAQRDGLVVMTELSTGGSWP